MLVTEGMNSRRSRRALVLCMAPHAGAWAGGAFSAIFIDVVELADRTRRSSRPCYARRLNFHVRLVCAHSPNSPAGVASAPFWGVVGWGGTSAGPNWAGAALLARICYLPRLAGASLPAWRQSAALLFASISAASAFALSCFAAFTSRCAAESSTRTLRLRYRHRHFLLRVPFGTREAAALWPGAGHARTC